MERRKYLGGPYKNHIKSFTSKTVRVDAEGLRGYASLLVIGEVNSPVFFGDTRIYDNGYSEINYLPDGENWMLSAIYDDGGGIIEWYFDITKKNAVDEENRPYSDDLYLDAALMPDGRILIFDENELSTALEDNKITRGEYDTAHEVLKKLMGDKIIGVAYAEALCSKLKRLLW